MFRLKTPQKILVGVILLLIIAMSGAIAIPSYLKNQEKASASASEVVDKVKEKPEAGIEDLDPKTLEKLKQSIDLYPGFLVRAEVDRQLKEGYITKRQYKEINELVDQKEQNAKTQSSISSSSSSI
jgi:ribosomal protein S13